MKEKREIYRFLHVTPRRIFEQLDQYVVGQRHAKEVLAIAAYNHLKRIEYLRVGRQVSIRKSNILMIGPSGWGKTYLARTLAKILDVPFAYNDATAFTEAGYYGEDVEVAIGRLLYAPNKYDDAEVDVSNILFICAGSFTDLDEETESKPIGFFENNGHERDEITSEDLVKYGFLPELLGRLPVRVQLDALGAEELVSILTQPRDAMVPEYQRLCALDQIQLDFTRDALLEIANAALKQKLGARALRAILEKVLHPILFVGPERAGERIVVEPDDVRKAVTLQ